MKINNLKNDKRIKLHEIQDGDVFELLEKFYIKTNEKRQDFTICVDLSDGSFAYLDRMERVLPVEASLDISNIK